MRAYQDTHDPFRWGGGPDLVNGRRAAAQREHLLHALDALDPVEREVVVLRVVRGMSAEAIGDRLGSCPRCVRHTLHRALDSLRITLDEMQL